MTDISSPTFTPAHCAVLASHLWEMLATALVITALAIAYVIAESCCYLSNGKLDLPLTVLK